MIMTDLEELYNAATHSQKCIQIAAGNTPQSYKFMLKWPDLCHSLIQYFEIKTPDVAQKLMKDFDEVINKPMKIIMESYIQTLKQIEGDASSFIEELNSINIDMHHQAVLDRKAAMVKLVNKIAARIRENGVQVEGIYDER
jgi:hypothetical protein